MLMKMEPNWVIDLVYIHIDSNCSYLGEGTTFFSIVYYRLVHESYIKQVKFLGVPKWTLEMRSILTLLKYV